MLFSSLIFIYAFLPVCLILYYLIKNLTYRNYILTVLSIVFYAAGEPKWVILLVASTAIDYALGLLIAKHGARTQASRWLVCISMIINISALFYFKYADFAITNLNYIPLFSIPTLKVIMPVGISFFTFQKITYIVDAYKGEIPPQKSFMKLLLYVSLFPQLIAGPILRYSDICAQLDHRVNTTEGFASGVTRFMMGMGKKVLLANYAGAVADSILGKNMKFENGSVAWLGILMYTFQIYFDFSGYSDMAIGLGKMFGFEYKENFNYPYTAVSITDFWRRWHISLSSFFRDYVYIPLGGNRRFQIRNIIVVWLLTGLWHGASWNFILWGAYYAVILTCEKLFLLGLLQKLPKALGWLYSMLAVMVGWAVFYFTDIINLGRTIKCMIGINGQPFFTDRLPFLLSENALLIAICIVASTPIITKISKLIPEGKAVIAKASLTAVFNCVVLGVATMSMIGSGFNPFLYFRF